MNSLKLNHKSFKAIIGVGKIKNIPNNIIFTIVNDNIIKFINNSYITHNKVVIIKNRFFSTLNNTITNISIPNSNSSISISYTTIEVNILLEIFITKSTSNKFSKIINSNNYITFTVNYISSMIINISKKIISFVLNIFAKNIKKSSYRIIIILTNNLR